MIFTFEKVDFCMKACSSAKNLVFQGEKDSQAGLEQQVVILKISFGSIISFSPE